MINQSISCLNMTKIKALILIPLLLFTVQGEIQVYFSPNGGCQDAVIQQITNAKSEILVAMYYLTEGDITKALINAKEQGINVQVFLDQSQLTEKYAKGKMLSNNGVSVRYDNWQGLMHNKFAVIDDSIVITGSFNWTATAEAENNENLLVIKSSELAKKYKDEFLKLWNKGVAQGSGTPTESQIKTSGAYVGSIKSDKFHYPWCQWAKKIKPENEIWFKTREEAIKANYKPCKVCGP